VTVLNFDDVNEDPVPERWLSLVQEVPASVTLKKEAVAESMTSTEEVVGVVGSEMGVVKVDDPLPSGRQPQTTAWYTLVPGGQALCSRSSKRDSSRP
jgi:hypothetical protein